jgi:hypothetical protein
MYLAVVASKLGTLNKGDTRQQQRKRGKQQVWPELAPTRPGDVDHPPGHEIREGVPGSYDKKHRCDQRRIETNDVRVVDQQEQRLDSQAADILPAQ